MSGFDSVVGFMFTFFVIMTVFLGIFFTYQSQTIENAKLLQEFEKTSMQTYNSNFEFGSPYYSSGRINFLINNKGTQNLIFDKKKELCMNLYKNNIYVPTDNTFIHVLKPLIGDYAVIEPNNIGISTLKTDLDLSASSNRFKLVSCEGLTKEFLLKSKDVNWWDTNWDERKKINVTNSASSSIDEYQVKVSLNSSNFDFSGAEEKNIRFLLDLKENYVLDLTFDDYTQQIIDYSKYSNGVYLGADSGAAVSDPTSSDGVVFEGLSYDGTNDYNLITQDNSLLLDKELTYSAWVKWNGDGNTLQNIFTNGAWYNALRVVNDGGVNDSKVLFQLRIDGVDKLLYSNVTLDNNWHFITGTYNGKDMKLYIDSILVGNLTSVGEVTTNLASNYIGTEGAGFYFNGSIDEVKILNLALTDSEVEDLFYDNLRFRELDYYTQKWDNTLKKAEIYVKVPYVAPNDNVVFEMYYDYLGTDTLSTESDMKKAFSYVSPKTVGFVVQDRISTTTGLNIFSLGNNNIIYVGDDVFNLDEQDGTTLGTASINQNDAIKMMDLGQVEGDGDADDMIVPISWAGTEFYYRGFRNANDRFCMLSPWGTANVEFFDNGASVYSGTVDSSGSCVDYDIPTNDAFELSSDIPILVSYAGSNQDAFVFSPATSEDLYGVPSQTLYVASGSSGATVDAYESDGTTNNYVLGSYGTISEGGNGGDGSSVAFKLVPTDPIGAIQQADSDGTESTVFVSKSEMSTKFGSNEATDYIAIVSPYSDANCTTYDSTGALVDNVPTGVGTNGVYKYDFDTGNDNLYLNARWKLECDKPVWPYYENSADNDDETNLFGYLQMKQYIYPSPIIVLS